LTSGQILPLVKFDLWSNDIWSNLEQIAVTLPSLLLAGAFVLFSLTTTLLSFEVSVTAPDPLRARAGVVRAWHVQAGPDSRLQRTTSLGAGNN
jgi:hypothetical protein